MSMCTAANRIKRELQEVTRSEDFAECTIKVETVNDRLQHLKGEISGPPDSPYEGGKFVLDIIIPDSYPFEPPKVKFVTRIWHPNISSQTGAICLDILKDEWAATMTLRTMLLSLQALLCSPEPDDPQDAVVAKQYKSNSEMFSSTARQWTHICAGGPRGDPSLDDKIKRLVELGVDKSQSLMALSSSDWDIHKATEFLFN